MKRLLRCAIATFALACAPCAGQCRWEPMEVYRGADRMVSCSTLFDPDGPGPAAEIAVFGGWFSAIGAASGRVVGWSGGTLYPLEPGWPASAAHVPVSALASSGGKLYAAANFSGLPGSSILLQWNGESWQTITDAVNGRIHKILSHEGELLIAGSFTSVAGVPARGIAAWNGVQWREFGGGISGAIGNTDPQVRALHPHDGGLIAAGTFTHAGGVSANSIASWDGVAWSAMGTGVASTLGGTPYLYALASWDERLIVGGYFNIAGGVQVNNIAAWDGSAWAPMGSLPSVSDLRIHNGSLHAAANSIFRWNGSAWEPLGSGTTGAATLLSHRGELIGAGSMVQAGGVPVSYIARWRGNEWRPLLASGYAPLASGSGGMGPAVSFGNELAAIGRFAALGSSQVSRAAAWNGASWRQAGDPVNTMGFQHIARHQGSVVLFSYYDMQLWNGETTTSVSLPFTHLGAEIYAAIEFEGDLVIGGYVGQFSATTISNIARWDGTQWHPFGAGLNAEPYALAVYQGQLYAGGWFSGSGATPLNRIARWNGSGWEPLGSGVDHYVWSMAVYDGELIVGGPFGIAGGIAAPGMARWNGAQWAPMGAGLPAPRRMLVWNDELIIAGDFTAVAGVPARGIAAWNGTMWRGFGDGIDGDPHPTVHQGELIVTGGFRKAGGRPAAGLARWTCNDCIANCDGSSVPPVLTTADFVCFLQRFAAGDPYANCDQSTAPPVLNVADFSCFLQKFAAGCP